MPGKLKPVPAGNKGLGKLPSQVRNKMGFMKRGGAVKKMGMGGKCRGMGAATKGGNFNKMGQIMNYSELTQAIKDYTENTETTFVDNIDDFVRQAEERIYRDVIIPELKKNATGNVSEGNQYLGRPSDFLSTFSLAVSNNGEYTYLLEKEVNFIREAYPNSGTRGLPKYYAIFDGDGASSDGNFIIGPTPDASYPMELHYYYDPPSIVTADTSWLGDNAETTLLYGSLIEAYTFMKGEPDILQLYQQRYESALLNMASLGVMLRGDIYRTSAA